MNKVRLNFGVVTKELAFKDKISAIKFINKVPNLIKKKVIYWFWDNDNKGYYVDMSKVFFVNYDLEGESN